MYIRIALYNNTIVTYSKSTALQWFVRGLFSVDDFANDKCDDHSNNQDPQGSSHSYGYDLVTIGFTISETHTIWKGYY